VLVVKLIVICVGDVTTTLSIVPSNQGIEALVAGVKYSPVTINSTDEFAGTNKDGDDIYGATPSASLDMNTSDPLAVTDIEADPIILDAESFASIYVTSSFHFAGVIISPGCAITQVHAPTAEIIRPILTSMEAIK
jgi:hypothetical protein